MGVKEITTDNEVMVTFDGYGNTGVTTLGLLKVSSMGFSSSAARENRREQKEKEKEYLRKWKRNESRKRTSGRIFQAKLLARKALLRKAYSRPQKMLQAELALVHVA